MVYSYNGVILSKKLLITHHRGISKTLLSKKSQIRAHTVTLCDSTYKYEAEEQGKITYGDNKQGWLPEVVRLGWKGAKGNFLE